MRGEQAVRFDVAGQALQGVLSLPDATATVGVVIVVGGPQYRVGSHRQFVMLARALAEQGHAVLRFDYRGMGDSEGEARSFEAVEADIAAAITELQRRVPEVERVVLWGLCDGASAALLYCHATRDPRVGGLVLLNPWVRSDTSLAVARVRHYYLERLVQPAFWAKLLRGGVGVSALAEWLRTARRARGGPGRAGGPDQPVPFTSRMARGWSGFSGPVLLCLSGRDLTAREFEESVRGDADWAGALERRTVELQRFEAADHTFSSAAAGTAVAAATQRWLRQHWPAHVGVVAS